MQVRITKCSYNSYWYAKKIGQIFDVENFIEKKYGGEKYKVIDYNHEYFIDKDDCILLDDQEQKLLVEIINYGHCGSHARGWYVSTNRVGEIYEVKEIHDDVYNRDVYEVIAAAGSHKEFDYNEGGLHIEKDDCKVISGDVKPAVSKPTNELRGRYRIIMGEDNNEH